MNSNGIVLSLGLLVAACAIPACAAEDASSPASAPEADLTAAAKRLVGAYQGEGSARPPYFEGLVLQSDGSFFADVDTGIRCVRAPCPSHVRLEGRFSATKNVLTLNPTPGQERTSYHGVYKFDAIDGLRSTLTLTREDGWTANFAKESSYCREATDCGRQSLIVPACVGAFDCEANRCAYQCGVPTLAVWPANATKLVAETAGGGFTPPPPPGSNCAFGQQKYTLDVASKELAWEICSFSDWKTPLSLEKGTKVLSDAAFQSIEGAMSGVTRSSSDLCGADKPMLTLEVTTPSGTSTYKDSFYSCMGEGNYVDGVDEVFGALRDAAR